MKKLIFTLMTLLVSLALFGQKYTYSLDTVHSGGILRVDSMYLVETTVGNLVGTGAVSDFSATSGTGDRSQSLSSPVFISDTSQLTTLVEQYLQDSTTLDARINLLRAKAATLGLKARAIEAIRDSVIYGAFIYVPENIWIKSPTYQEGIGAASNRNKLNAWIDPKGDMQVTCR